MKRKKKKILSICSFYSEMFYTIMDFSAHSFYLYVFRTKFPPSRSQGIELRTCTLLITHRVLEDHATFKCMEDNPNGSKVAGKNQKPSPGEISSPSSQLLSFHCNLQLTIASLQRRTNKDSNIRLQAFLRDMNIMLK